jgi:hypothetical protein
MVERAWPEGAGGICKDVEVGSMVKGIAAGLAVGYRRVHKCYTHNAKLT